MRRSNTFVISDLHIGAGQLEDFDSELEGCLCEFLGTLSSKDGGIELVINGDFLEFLQSPPWDESQLESHTKDKIPLCFSQEQSVRKLEEIYKEHEPAFKSLGDFLGADSGNRLVILPGNHDADFFWPDVRSRFAQYVCDSSEERRKRLIFHLEQHYTPPDWPEVWIEHGHQHDPVNSFYVGGRPCWSESAPPIFEDIEGRQRLFECIGSRFLIKYMNRLDKGYPFVDNIKPFSRFLNLFGRSIFTGKAAPFKAAFAVWGMLRYLSRVTVSHRGDLLDSPEEESVDPRAVLEQFREALPEDQETLLRDALNDRGLNLNQSLEMYISDKDDAENLMDFMADNLDLADIAEQEEPEEVPPPEEDDDEGYLEMREAFEVDETALLVDAAIKILRDKSVKAVIMGHTHDAVTRPEGLNYINSGCWTRYYRHGKDDEIPPWLILKQGSYQYFPYKLDYVEINQDLPLLIERATFKERKK